MSAILDLPSFRERVMPMTVKDYHRLGDVGVLGKRTELIRGYIFKKMSKSPLHTSLALRLHGLLAALLSEFFLIRLDGPLTLADSEPEPDLAVVRGKLADFWKVHPTTAELVIEIAVTTLLEDREMATIYAEAGIKEYWIVSGTRNEIEVYHSPEGGKYQHRLVYTAAEVIESTALPGVRLNVASIFAPEA